MSHSRITEPFGITPNIVANQWASVIRKAGVKNTTALIRLASNEKMVMYDCHKGRVFAGQWQPYGLQEQDKSRLGILVTFQ